VSQIDAGLWSPGYRELPAPAGTGAALVCLWISVTPPGSEPATTDVLPDGCTDLIWQHGRGAFFAGPDTGPVPAIMPPRTVLVGVRFRPGAGGPALGIPLADVRDQRIDLAELVPGLASKLPAEMSKEEIFDRLSHISLRLTSEAPPDPVVRHVTALLAAGQVAVADLARAAAISERQLLRRFDAAVGYGPKTLHRVLRFCRASDAMRAARGRVDLAAVASQAGYADQAHLTREVTRMAGVTPGVLAGRLAAS
jgi:AraC-like DNA-binding protein